MILYGLAGTADIGMLSITVAGVVPTWLVYTIWFITKAGWPYYTTTLASVLGLLPGVLLCSGCAVACWVVHRYFRPAEPPTTLATRD